MIIPFSFLSSYLTSKLPKRTIILIGLLIYLVGGIGPQIASSIEVLLLFRLILGAGGLATMWEAVFADVGVALLAILNAVRIQRMKFN